MLVTSYNSTLELTSAIFLVKLFIISTTTIVIDKQGIIMLNI